MTRPRENNKHTIPFDWRWDIYTKYKRHCWLCGNGKIPSQHGAIRLIDNKLDRENIDNFIFVCKSCNFDMKSMSVEKFREYLEKAPGYLINRIEGKVRILRKFKILKIQLNPKIKFYYERNTN